MPESMPERKSHFLTDAKQAGFPARNRLIRIDAGRFDFASIPG
jgi:hypothetical protein